MVFCMTPLLTRILLHRTLPTSNFRRFFHLASWSKRQRCWLCILLSRQCDTPLAHLYLPLNVEVTNDLKGWDGGQDMTFRSSTFKTFAERWCLRNISNAPYQDVLEGSEKPKVSILGAVRARVRFTYRNCTTSPRGMPFWKACHSDMTSYQMETFAFVIFEDAHQCK